MINVTEFDNLATIEASEGYASEESTSDAISNPETDQFTSKKEQVFVNRNLNLSQIRCYGFDMDYTLCEYISPQFDELAFNLAKKFLVDHKSYSSDILKLEYNPKFPVRGLWFDKTRGNLLKVDHFGKILDCRHGLR